MDLERLESLFESKISEEPRINFGNQASPTQQEDGLESITEL